MLHTKDTKVGLDSIVVNAGNGQMRSIGKKIHSDILPLAPMSDEENNAFSNMMPMVSSGEVITLLHSPVGTSKFLAIPERIVCQTSNWLETLNLDSNLCNITAFACCGSGFHIDENSFGNNVFAIVWLDFDASWDLYFPQVKRRIELHYGSIVLFDSSLVHGVVKRGRDTFSVADFECEPVGVFVSFDLEWNAPNVAEVMGIKAIESVNGDTPEGFWAVGRFADNAADVDPVDGSLIILSKNKLL